MNLNNTITGYDFALPITGTLTCGQGNYWNLTVSQTSVTDSTRVYPQYTTTNPSRVDLPTTTVINVNSIRFYDAAYSGGNLLSSVATGSTVYIRAVVSDPFGSYDIVNAPTIIIKNPSGTTIVPSTTMTYKATGTETPSLTKTYEYSYIVPSSPTGNWSVSVTATEGTEGTVTNTAYTTMPVVIPQPVLTVLKSADKSSVVPGNTITYTVIITNTGTGIATSVVATDPLPKYTTYVANSTLLNGITVAGDGVTFPLIAGLLVDDNTSRGAGVAATGILPPHSGNVGVATVIFRVTVN